jgi:hypothetical protein
MINDNIITTAQAIKSLDNNAEFSIRENVITWIKGEFTQTEIDAELTRLQAEFDALKYQRDRQYPTWQEQMDMQYHDEIDGTTTWKDAVAKVKADNPKPE